MHGVLREYRLDPGNVDEVVGRIAEGGVPILRAIPGFVSYAINDAGSGLLRMYAVYESAAGTQESTRAAGEWVRANVGHLLPNPPTVTEGDLAIRTFKSEPRFAVLRRYRVDPRNVETIATRARDGFVPIISALPGFASYSLLDAGNGTIVTLSGFTNQAGADESINAAAAWIRDNLGPLMPNPPEVSSGQMKLFVTASSQQGSTTRSTSRGEAPRG